MVILGEGNATHADAGWAGLAVLGDVVLGGQTEVCMLIIPLFYYNILVCNNNWKNFIEMKKYNSKLNQTRVET